MAHSSIRFGFSLTGGLLLTLAAWACSSSDDPAPPAGSPDAGEAGAGGDGAGGSPSTGGTTSTGGSGTGPSEGDYTLEACPGAEAISGVGAALPDCNDICAGAFCVPADLAGGAAAALPDCPNGDKCIPEAIIDTGGAFEFKHCTFFLNSTVGRCVPTCLAGENASLLEQDVCGSSEVCAPCINPLDEQPTGACDIECPDAPPAEDAGADVTTTEDAGNGEEDSGNGEEDSGNGEEDSGNGEEDSGNGEDGGDAGGDAGDAGE